MIGESAGIVWRSGYEIYTGEDQASVGDVLERREQGLMQNLAAVTLTAP